MKKVFINSVYDTSYDCLFPGWEIVHSDHYADLRSDVDLVLLVGHMSDTDPALYGEENDGTSYVDKAQDQTTITIAGLAGTLGIPVIGICKGAQQMCVMAGGKLIQDVPRVGSHTITDMDGGEYIPVQADHHQVMVPPEGARVLYKNVDTGYPEVVIFDKKRIGIQYHPEWCREGSKAAGIFQLAVNELLK